MSLFYNLREGVSGAINYVVDEKKPQEFPHQPESRVSFGPRSTSVYCFGKYYFHNLQSWKTGETEFYCLEVIMPTAG